MKFSQVRLNARKYFDIVLCDGRHIIGGSELNERGIVSPTRKCVTKTEILFRINLRPRNYY